MILPGGFSRLQIQIQIQTVQNASPADRLQVLKCIAAAYERCTVMLVLKLDRQMHNVFLMTYRTLRSGPWCSLATNDKNVSRQFDLVLQQRAAMRCPL